MRRNGGYFLIEENNIYTIKELTNHMKSLFDNDSLLTNVWIRGEISNFTHHSSGHMYFTLKDESSRLRSIMFAGNNRYLKFIPQNGTKIIARGYISIYERDGQYQFYAQEMQPDGIGQLYLAYEQLKNGLEEEGLFKEENKKLLPHYPKSIGIVTSATGAAVRDMITTINRRYPYVNILIYPVLVQGKGAAKSIAEAIKQLNKYGGIDVLIVGRGGGSIEELWAFNEEIVARSIFESKIPIISSVGHETDFTIADFVADVRAPTPTAAAEIAVPNVIELTKNINYFVNMLEKIIDQQLNSRKNDFRNIISSVVFRRPKQYLLKDSQQIDYLQDRMQNGLNVQTVKQKENLMELKHKLLQEKPKDRIHNEKEKLNVLVKQISREINVSNNFKKGKVSAAIAQLDALSPLKVMKRGYAIPYDEQEKNIIRTIDDIQLGDTLKVRISDGTLDCQIWGMEEESNE